MSLSLELKADGSIDAESEGGDCNEVMRAGLGEPGGEWTGFGWQNDADGADFIGRARRYVSYVLYILKDTFVR